jgi:hypothetical protein
VNFVRHHQVPFSSESSRLQNISALRKHHIHWQAPLFPSLNSLAVSEQPGFQRWVFNQSLYYKYLNDYSYGTRPPSTVTTVQDTWHIICKKLYRATDTTLERADVPSSHLSIGRGIIDILRAICEGSCSTPRNVQVSPIP